MRPAPVAGKAGCSARRLVALPGIEPGCPGGRWILSPLRLPVPPEGPSSRRAVCSTDCYPAFERDRGEIEQPWGGWPPSVRRDRAGSRSAGENLPEKGGTTLAVWVAPPCPASVGQKHEGDQHDPHYRRCAFRVRARLVRRFRPDGLHLVDGHGLERHLHHHDHHEERLDRHEEEVEEGQQEVGEEGQEGRGLRHVV